MVYKTERHGVRTGNTFKRWNSKYFRNYGRQAYIVRSHRFKEPTEEETTDFAEQNQFAKTCAFGEGDSMIDDVHYSLNKQARWELPEILEHKILFEDHEEDYGIELVERHRITQMANCINVYATSGVYKDGKINTDRRFLCKNRGGYCQSNSVLKNRNKRKKNRRRRREPEVEQTVGDSEPEIRDENKLRYEVLRPVPRESYLCHVNKTIGNNTYKGFVWNGYQDKQQRCRKHRRITNDIRESLNFMDDQFDDSEEEDFHHEADDIFDDGDKVDYHVTLDDILLHAKTANKLASNKSRLHSDSSVSSTESQSAKGRVVYLDRTDDSINTETDFTAENSSETDRKKHLSTVLEPVHVILANHMVTPHVLADTYGKHYIECACFPRKFILNISHILNQHDLCASSGSHAEVCLVFVHDVDNEINNEKETVYKIFLNANMSANMSSVRIETLFDYMDTGVDEIIERSLFFIETLPEGSIVCKNVSKSYRKKHSRQTPLEQCANWSTDTYNPDNDFLLDYFISQSASNVQEAVDMGYELVTGLDVPTDSNSENIAASPKGQFCCICYSNLDVSMPGTALIACSHWFCDMCWKEYLETRIMEGAHSLTCPEFDCDTSVDSGTVLSLMNLRDVIKHAKRCHDTSVEQQEITKWCPNETCGRVLKVNSVYTKNCQCLCGMKMCFDCLDPPHWPASCESVKKYYKRMRDTGDISLEPPELRPPIVVHSKPCPSCHRFVEKNGGCPSMICVCKASFCWGCGQLWHTRAHGSDCYSQGYKDTHGTTARTFVQTNVLDNKQRHKWYKMALIHRLNQHPGRLHILKMAVKPLSRKVQGYVFNAEKSGKPVNLNFELSDKTFDREYEKASYLVKNTVDLYSEINHVIENTAVLLISEELPEGNGDGLKRISRRLSGFSDALYELFKHHDSIHAKTVVDKLTEVRFHSRKAMQSLIRCIKSMQL